MPAAEVFITAAPLGGRPSAEGLMELCGGPETGPASISFMASVNIMVIMVIMVTVNGGP